MGKFLRIVTAYAPQTGCKEEEKNMFWQELDLNGHVEKKRNGAGKCHENHGYGACNVKGERILEFAQRTT
ncbi:unnamed protein product [Strongylus vulgaris]|uniref:Uncharacterized protein n=1 Tax=Strongylus vulgaris TaxID=40348 RepID=A0A3P7J4H8_STRVU|nr:unnamed protein product [Strongylus vulgaris]